MPSTDITYCTRECGNMECKRNKKTLQILEEERTFYISMCDFKDCKEWRKRNATN